MSGIEEERYYQHPQVGWKSKMSKIHEAKEIFRACGISRLQAEKALSLLEAAEEKAKPTEICCTSCSELLLYWQKIANLRSIEIDRLMDMLHSYSICCQCGKQLSKAEAQSVHTCDQTKEKTNAQG